MSTGVRKVIITAPHDVCVSEPDEPRDCDRRAFYAAMNLYRQFRLRGVPTTIFFGNELRKKYDLNRDWNGNKLQEKHFGIDNERRPRPNWHRTLEFELERSKREYDDVLLIDTHSFPNESTAFDLLKTMPDGSTTRTTPKIAAMIRSSNGKDGDKRSFSQFADYMEAVFEKHEPSTAVLSSDINYNIRLAEKHGVRGILIEFCEDHDVLSDRELDAIVEETASFFHKAVTGGSIVGDIGFLIGVVLFPLIFMIIRDVLDLNGFLKVKDSQKSKAKK